MPPVQAIHRVLHLGRYELLSQVSQLIIPHNRLLCQLVQCGRHFVVLLNALLQPLLEVAVHLLRRSESGLGASKAHLSGSVEIPNGR